MRTFSEYILEARQKYIFGGTDDRNTVAVYDYAPEGTNELHNLIVKLVKERGNDGDFNDIDTSNVTNMDSIFLMMNLFNGDISQWDTSNVTDMSCMFYRADKFNGDISNWDVSYVTNMSAMFERAYSFNQPIGKWDVSRATDMEGMFHVAEKFDQDISNWDVSNVKNFTSIFLGCPIKQMNRPTFRDIK